MSDTNLREINKDLLDKYSAPRDEYLDINPNPDGSFTTSPPRVRDQRTGEVFEVDPATGQRVQTELPPGRTPSLAERLLGPQMQMPSTGFFIPQNDYTGVSGTITRKGAHIAVANELEKIKFVAGTFGGMQNRVAIIRYWTKKDATRTAADSRVLQTSTPITQLDVANRIASLTGTPTTPGQLPPAPAPAQATLESCSGLSATAGQFNSLGGSFQGSPDPIVSDGLLTPIAEQELAKYENQYNTVANDPRYGQKFLSSISPENTPARLRERVRGESDDGLPAEARLGDAARIIAAAGANAAQSVTNNIYTPNGCQAALQSQNNVLLASTRPGSGQVFPIPQSERIDPVVPNSITPPTVAPKVNPPQQIPWSFPSGQIIKGEPGVNFNFSAPSPLPPWSFNAGTVYDANPGSVNKTPISALSSPTQAAWRFLFNPEELQLESGPEFNRAETWGVSDLPGSGAANSGQPLAWRFNKNRKLIFGKVLLTGYVLGRRVDSLEKGLQQLFMARSGPGMDGPPVLEFVWGRRVFGPCVIQNLRVRERAWDNGHLVNAEVSFDLEQVPEWTINDGAVDIARPGRQSLVNDPFLPRAEPEQPGTGAAASTTPPPQNQPGGGGGKPTSTVTPSLQAKCQAAYKKQGEFAGLAGKLTNFRIQATQISQIGSPFESLDSYRKRVLSAITGPYLKEYGDLHREASSLVGDGFTFRVGGYYSPTTLSVRVSSFAANKTKSIEDVAAEIRIAAQKAQAASKNVVDSECKEVIKPNR